MAEPARRSPAAARGAIVLAIDVGTTGAKTCLYRIGDKLESLGSALAEYPLLTPPGGGAEQRADDWWSAICRSTKRILKQTGTAAADVAGIAFCCQMQGSIFVDRDGAALRNPMIYMDARATKQIEDALYTGPLRIEKINAFKLLPSLWITGGMAATAKDPLWKYHWVRENEPAVFGAAYKWLDVKDYLAARCTGQFAMTQDSANITFVYDTRPGKLGWSRELCALFGVNRDHLPPVIKSTDRVGELAAGAARELGLREGTPVFGGGGDVSCISLGAGCTRTHDTHIYVGTSGWVVANVEKRMVDIGNFIASILGAIPGRYNYVAEQETSGLCLAWVRDHLALDEIGVYLDGRGGPKNRGDRPLYELLNETVEQTPPGAGGVIFTPWLHGNRAPREDPFVRAMFFNVGLNTGKRMLVRAVLEGVAYHKRWMLEAMEKRIPRQSKLRFVGGGAKSEVWCQIMADVTGRTIETIENPQDAGAVGAAMIAGVGMGAIPSFAAAHSFVPLKKSYEPRGEFRALYDRGFAVFQKLYQQNKKLFWAMNRD
jgi:xylulokinase